MNDVATSSRRFDRTAAPIWHLCLWGLADSRLDRVLTVATVLLLAASRFLLLPSGPWEWDETLFARGLLRFDLTAHFPHPPGFPLWLGLGWYVLPLVKEPLHGLQLLSSLASCLTLWPLAALGRRVAPAAVATAAALMVLFAPGVWLHAVRGFSSTPAAFLALWAAAVASGGLHGRRVTAFTLLVAAAFLTRPILLPSLGLLWLGIAVGVRPLQRLLPGIGLSVLAGTASIIGLIHAQGDVASFLAAFATHAQRHTRNLVYNVGTLPEYGFIKGLGGEWFALSLVLLAGLGLLVWWRRVGRQAALTWLVVMTVGTVQLIHLQGRTFPRYSVPFQTALAPLAAGAAAALAPPALAVAGLGMTGLALGWDAFPLLVEQQSLRMPGWDAVITGMDLARRKGLEVVVDPGLFPYYSYREEVLRWRGEEPPRRHLSPASPDFRSLPHGHFILITDRPDLHLPSLQDREIRFGRVSPELQTLTQGRFLRAAVLMSPPLLLDGWWPRERPSETDPFVWGRPGARMALAGLPPDSFVDLDLRPATGSAPLVIWTGEIEGQPVPGDSRRGVVSVALPDDTAGRLVQLTFERDEGYPPGPADRRPLAVQLFGVRVFSRHLSWVLNPDDRELRERLGISLAGFWDAEGFPWGRGRWTHSSAAIHLPPLHGRLELELAAPRSTDPGLVITCQGRRYQPELAAGTGPVSIVIPLPCDPEHPGEPLTIGLTTTGFKPGGADTRDLGVVVGSLTYRPAPSSTTSP